MVHKVPVFMFLLYTHRSCTLSTCATEKPVTVSDFEKFSKEQFLGLTPGRSAFHLSFPPVLNLEVLFQAYFIIVFTAKNCY